MKRILTVLILMMLTIASAAADDTDIYLKTDTENSAPPYLMIMLDYSPEIFSRFCKSFEDCAPKMTERAFIKLCAQYGFPKVTRPELSRKNKEKICRNRFLDIEAGGEQNGQLLCKSPGRKAGYKGQNTNQDDNFPGNSGFGCDDFSEGYSQMIDTGNYTWYQAFVAYLSAMLEDVNNLYVGVMVSNSGKKKGGTILEGFKLLKPGDSNGARKKIISTLNSIPRAQNHWHYLQPSETFYEFYQYLNGRPLIHHTSTSGNFSAMMSPRDEGIADYDQGIIDANGTHFVSPFANEKSGNTACIKLFGLAVVASSAEYDDDLDARVSIEFGRNATGGFESLLYHISDRKTDIVDDSLVKGIQNMKVWMVTDKKRPHVGEWAKAGGTGDPQLILGEGSGFEPKLYDMFTRILATSSSFVAASVPVSVFNETRSMDDFLLAVFEADKGERWAGNIKKLALHDVDGRGDIRVLDRLNLETAVANPDSGSWVGALDPGDGHIRNDSLTFWTDETTLPPPGKNEVDERDGRAVTRGGAGQKIPEFVSDEISYSNVAGARQIYVEDTTASTGVTDLNATDALGNELYGMFNIDSDTRTWLEQLTGQALTDAEAARMMIHYIRGVDLLDAGYDFDSVSGTGPAREWILGDVIHSKPLALNYGYIDNSSGDTWHESNNPYVNIIFGANDGMLHFLQNTGPDPVTDGALPEETGIEQFAFMPRELLKIIPELARNDGLYDNPNGTNFHPYGMDNEVSALVFDDLNNPNNNRRTIDHPDTTDCNDCKDFAYVYAAMRRGGKSIYHLDVTNPFVPPEYLGKISQGGDFSELGLTFSRPIPVLVKYGTSVTPALVFGGGYDNNAYDDYGDTDDTDDSYNHFQALDRTYPVYTYEDAEGNGHTGNTLEGNAIYIVNALDRSLIWKVTYGALKGASGNSEYTHTDMKYSIPSNVAPFDANGNGLMDRLYVGDVAGNVWRADLPSCNTKADCEDANFRRDNWSASVVAKLGKKDPAVVSDADKGKGDIRFFHAPAIVPVKDDGDRYDGIVMGSGDRANPLEERDENHIFMIKDRAVTSGKPPATTLTIDDLADVTGCVETFSGRCMGLHDGWRIKLPAGEKILSSPVVAGGQVFLTSYTPLTSVSSCAPAEGVSSLYLIDLKDGVAANDNNKRSKVIAAGISEGITTAGDTIILPGMASQPFLYDDVLDDGSPRRGSALTTPSGMGGIYIDYWREKNLDNIK